MTVGCAVTICIRVRSTAATSSWSDLVGIVRTSVVTVRCAIIVCVGVRNTTTANSRVGLVWIIRAGIVAGGWIEFSDEGFRFAAAYRLISAGRRGEVIRRSHDRAPDIDISVCVQGYVGIPVVSRAAEVGEEGAGGGGRVQRRDKDVVIALVRQRVAARRWRKERAGRDAGDVNAARSVEGDAIWDVHRQATEVGGIDERRTERVKFCDEAFLPAIVDRLVDTWRHGEVDGLGHARHVSVTGGVRFDVVGGLVICAAEVGGVGDYANRIELRDEGVAFFCRAAVAAIGSLEGSGRDGEVRRVGRATHVDVAGGVHRRAGRVAGTGLVAAAAEVCREDERRAGGVDLSDEYIAAKEIEEGPVASVGWLEGPGRRGKIRRVGRAGDGGVTGSVHGDPAAALALVAAEEGCIRERVAVEVQFEYEGVGVSGHEGAEGAGRGREVKRRAAGQVDVARGVQRDACGRGTADVCGEDERRASRVELRHEAFAAY